MKASYNGTSRLKLKDYGAKTYAELEARPWGKLFAGTNISGQDRTEDEVTVSQVRENVSRQTNELAALLQQMNQSRTVHLNTITKRKEDTLKRQRNKKLFSGKIEGLVEKPPFLKANKEL